METWTHVTDVESDSEPGTRHAIKRRSDGAWGCSCTAFRFARGQIGLGKSCKHLRAYLGLDSVGQMLATSGPPTMTIGTVDTRIVDAEGRDVAVPVSVLVGRERLTFRRAISFGRI